MIAVKKLIFLYVIIIILLVGDGVFSKDMIKRIPVAVNKLNLRAEPNIASKVLYQLYVGENVTIVKSLNVETIIDNKKGQWVYVKTFRGVEENLKYGWIFDYFLGYENNFKKLEKWDIDSYSNCVGDYCPSYIFKNDGSFIMNLWQYHDENSKIEDIKNQCTSKGGVLLSDLKCQYSGHLYKYLNLIWAKNDSKVNQKHFLFITEKNTLCLPFAECEASR